MARQTERQHAIEGDKLIDGEKACEMLTWEERRRLDFMRWRMRRAEAKRLKEEAQAEEAP